MEMVDGHLEGLDLRFRVGEAATGLFTSSPGDQGQLSGPGKSVVFWQEES